METRPLISLDDQELLAGCDVDFHRVKGPGGQKRNKTSSAVRIRHQATGLIVTATEERSQHINKTRAIHRLREAIALHLRNPIDFQSYSPSEMLGSCITSDGRLRVGRRDERYFPVMSEVLDVLAACGLRVSDAAKLLGTSTGQLVAFFENDPKLWERVNQMRAQSGKKPLR